MFLNRLFCKISRGQSFGQPDCILCTQRRRSSAWIKQNTMANIANIGVSSAWNSYGMHPGRLDAIFVLTATNLAGQKAISGTKSDIRDISFLCHPACHPDTGTSM